MKTVDLNYTYPKLYLEYCNNDYDIKYQQFNVDYHLTIRHEFITLDTITYQVLIINAKASGYELKKIVNIEDSWILQGIFNRLFPKRNLVVWITDDESSEYVCDLTTMKPFGDYYRKGCKYNDMTCSIMKYDISNIEAIRLIKYYKIDRTNTETVWCLT